MRAMDVEINPQFAFSSLSLIVTCYFWFVRVRKERPHLEFHQLSNYRVTCRRVQGRDDIKRLSFQQLEEGGVLIVNHSLRQNSIVLFECFLPTGTDVVAGDWGYSGDDKPPWNIGPETSIAFSPACSFDVPSDYDVPDDPVFYLKFVTASGKRFTHRFRRLAPKVFDDSAHDEQPRRAA